MPSYLYLLALVNKSSAIFMPNICSTPVDCTDGIWPFGLLGTRHVENTVHFDALYWCLVFWLNEFSGNVHTLAGHVNLLILVMFLKKLFYKTNLVHLGSHQPFKIFTPLTEHNSYHPLPSLAPTPLPHCTSTMILLIKCVKFRWFS